MFAIKISDLQSPRLQSINAAQIYPVLARLKDAVVERINATGAAKPVVHVIVAPMVQAKVILTFNQFKIFRCNIARGHDRVFHDAYRAIALQRGGNRLALEPELDGTAMAGARVLLFAGCHDLVSADGRHAHLCSHVTGHNVAPVSR